MCKSIFGSFFQAIIFSLFVSLSLRYYIPDDYDIIIAYSYPINHTHNTMPDVKPDVKIKGRGGVSHEKSSCTDHVMSCINPRLNALRAKEVFHFFRRLRGVCVCINIIMKEEVMWWWWTTISSCVCGENHHGEIWSHFEGKIIASVSSRDASVGRDCFRCDGSPPFQLWSSAYIAESNNNKNNRTSAYGAASHRRRHIITRHWCLMCWAAPTNHDGEQHPIHTHQSIKSAAEKKKSYFFYFLSFLRHWLTSPLFITTNRPPFVSNKKRE